MKIHLSFWALLFATVSMAQVTKTNTKMVTKQVANLNTKISGVDKNDAAYMAFADLIGIASDEFLYLNDLVIYPNPNDGKFSIKFTEKPGAMLDIIIYDIKSEIIFQSRTDNTNKVYETNIDISNQPAGDYYLIFRQDNFSQTRKIIKT